ncbi:MAG TPA: DNA internalization-related competence protein ComEC/Rec2 [Halomonas sp.]|nr:DNA internalization-related competence protein ComEC/Rec2 [Halomonas sp.]
MRYGWALPLALMSLVGVLTGMFASAALLQALAALGLYLLARRCWSGVACAVVILLVAARLISLDGAELPAGLSRQDLRLDARLESLTRQGRLTRISAVVEQCQPLDPTLLACNGLRRVRLSLYQPLALSEGERWRFTVRLRPPSGLHNPGAFDYRGWLKREGIQATGYVRKAPEPRRLAAAPPSLRAAALGYLDRQSISPLGRRWLAALTLGAGERLDDDDWERLNATGTTHLMVISGLHVALLAGLALWLARKVAKYATPGAWRLAVWPWWFAGGAALGFGLLSGFEPPAMRAVIMALVGLWVASGRHAPGPWQAWWLALFLVLLYDPLSAWRPGLWLSFVAVATLIIAWQGRPRPSGVGGWLWALVRTQCLLAPVMAAAVLLAFGRLAPAAPLVNLLAVPLVGSLMVPLGLAGWLLNEVPLIGAWPWWLFDQLAQATALGLEQAAAYLPLWHARLEWRLPLALGLGLLSLCWLLPGLPGPLRWLATGVLLALPLALEPDRPAPGEVRLTVHDVGQGQMVSLQTHRYRLLVDSGPRFASGFTPLGAIWPGRQRFDEVIVSHDDRDHAGGVAVLKQQHAVGRYLAPIGSELPVAFTPCAAGRRWRQDGVDFEMLWPPPGVQNLSDNDRSCVLLVTAGSQRLLITGDAGRAVERQLLPHLPGELDVLVAGHHGSKTSSSLQLVEATRPSVVIYSAALDNSFGHPAAEVVRRFRRRGSCQLSTARDGAIGVTLGNSAGSERLSTAQSTSLLRAVERHCLAVESDAEIIGGGR